VFEINRYKPADNQFAILTDVYLQGGSNMTGTDLCVNKPHLSRSYLNHLVFGTVATSRSEISNVTWVSMRST